MNNVLDKHFSYNFAIADIKVLIFNNRHVKYEKRLRKIMTIRLYISSNKNSNKLYI